MALMFIVIGLFAFYSLIIGRYSLSWKFIPDHIPSGDSPQTKISVIIPARNEEKNIASLLDALQGQSYSKELFEVIVIDDHSTDQTGIIVRQYPKVKLLQLEDEGINSYKKKAIETGIAASEGDLIVTTDADCIPGSDWLKTIATFKEEYDSVFIVAPVVLIHNNSALQLFQALDFLVLQGITGVAAHWGRHSMCNGANLAYEKKSFNEVNGFTGIDNIASGDDMLLMHKIWKKHPDKVDYLKSKEAIVSTQPMTGWKDFFNQRIRWASKARHYEDKSIFFVLLIVYFFNLSFLAVAVSGFFWHKYWIYLGIMWFAKTIIELRFVYTVASFFSKQSLLKYFFFFQPLHIIYTIISGLLGQFGTYEWKGRRVK